MTIQQIKDEIASIQKQIQPLAQRKALLERQLRDAESIEFIRVNNITKEDVEMSNGDGKPYFGTCFEFGAWARLNSNKFWLEWNGGIYRKDELINGKMRDNPGKVEHLS